jgi:membrane-bound lytic murein transglycosylase F
VNSRTLLAVAVGFTVAVSLTACLPSPHRTGDVEEIRQAGVLRIAVRPGYFDAVGSRELSRRESELLRQFAARLGVEIRWIEAHRGDRLLTLVREGSADIAVGRYAVESLAGEGLRASAALGWVDDLLVAFPGSSAGCEDRASSTVHIHRSALTTAVNTYLSKHSLSVEEVAEEVPIEEVLARVRTGRYRLTIVDSQIANAIRGAAGFKIVDRIPVRRPIVWAVRESNPGLRRAIDQFLFAESVLSRGVRARACRDMRDIRRAGALRLVTRNSATTVTIERGGLSGFEYELALNFARHLGVRLELSIPPPDVDPLRWLEDGYGDIAALHEPFGLNNRASFLVSDPYRWVDLVSVVSSRAERPASVEELAGVRAMASQAEASLARIMPLTAPIRARPPAVGGDSFNAMLAVARGRAPVAVVNRDAARLAVESRSDLQIGAVVVPEAGLVWVLNLSSPKLLREVNQWLHTARTSGLVRQLAAAQFGKRRASRTGATPPIPDGALSPYDELLQWVGRTNDIDWRLLASLMYEESRFDPDAVGPGGSAGLFQFMPSTWRELGVEDPHHPQEATEAAGRYLRQLMDEFQDVPLRDGVAMAIASYNVGPGHVFDARKLAVEMGLDPDRWAGSVETAMLILDDPEVARGFSAGVCACRRAVGYTRRILRRYGAYTEQFPPA